MQRANYFAILTALVAALTSFTVRGAEPPPRPNVIFILVDDLGFGDYGVFFQNQRRAAGDRTEPWHFTPQLDAMAATGVQFRQHYCPAPVCAPSRASLLLGVHQGHSNVRDNQFDKALENNHTLGSVMRGAGYATAAIGKWGLQGGAAVKNRDLGPEMTPDAWPGYPTHRGFDDYFGYVRHRDGHAHYPKEDGKQVWDNDREVSAELDGCYTADLFTARAKKWITERHAADPRQPFFLYLAFDTPHAKLQLPAAPYPAGGGLDGGVQWLGKPGQMINTADGTPDSYIHPDYAGQTWDHDSNPATPEQPWPDVYQRYATDVRRLDDCVGDLLDLLVDLGIDKNTLVVFATDNGPSKESYLPQSYHPYFFNSFGPMDGIKRDVWEGGIRVGAIAHWPSGTAGSRVSELPSQFHDWMPTFAELAGVAAPARCDGTSLVPTLTGQREQKPPLVYVEYQNNGKTPDYPEFESSHRGRVRQQMQAIRMGDFMGVRYRVRAHDDAFEIYNVVADPKQTRNRAAEHPDLQRQMHDAVLRMRRPDPSAPRPYDKELIPAISSPSHHAGVQWRLYEEAAPWLPRLDDLEPQTKGVAESIEACPAPSDSQALLVGGMLEVPVNGKYTFTLPAGATALLRIHDATVIDAAFAPGSEEVSGTVALQAGIHPFRLYWGRGGDVPQLRISGPALSRQPLPVKMLGHE